MTQHTLELPEVDLVYDVYGPLPTADSQPPLVTIGQPMDLVRFADDPVGVGAVAAMADRPADIHAIAAFQ